MLSQEHFIGYVTTTSNITFTNNFETNGAPYLRRFLGFSPGPFCSSTSFSHLSSQSSCYLRVLSSYAYFLPSRPEVNKKYTVKTIHNKKEKNEQDL